MGLTQRIMRLLAPTCEQHRMEFRKARDCVNAHAEDIKRTLAQMQQVPVRAPSALEDGGEDAPLVARVLGRGQQD